MLSVITLQNSKRNMKIRIGIAMTKGENQTIQTMRKIKQVSLVKREGFGSPFFYLCSEAWGSDRKLLKRKTRKLAFVLSNFLESQKCHKLLQKCHSQTIRIDTRYHKT